MAQGPTNVNLIATYIHNNPGCRRVDLKRMLHFTKPPQANIPTKNTIFGARTNTFKDMATTTMCIWTVFGTT